jgi:predicted unusual protein kinase regulating ubiquinone biosynthesis (AarF/ABC1/UbiB family)
MIGRRPVPCWLAVVLAAHHCQALSTTTLTAPKAPAVTQLGEFNVAQLQEYEGLRGRFDRDKILGFLAKRPWTVAGRLGYVSRVFLDTKNAWESQESLPEDQRTRGATLNAAMAGLGPVSVKVGQTLSQRPDLVGEEACEALKSLQTKNRPFSNAAALQSVAVEFKLNSTKNVAPNIGGLAPQECLFASFSEEPAAAASLGQVYKARTHDNREVAVKVQRPDALRTVAIDYTCFAVVWKLIERWWSFQRKLKGEGPFDNGDIGDVVDTVAISASCRVEAPSRHRRASSPGMMEVGGFFFDFERPRCSTQVADGLFDELDYDLEALNADRFRESLDFLGFVDVPTFLPELSTNRVLTTEWIRGAHLEALSVKDGALMTQLAVEACTASLVLTGYVHADPHEGNLMLREDGKVVFLDFGLMSGVDGYIMESFAQGIRACLAEDYESLARAFQDVGFLTTPLQFRENPKQAYELYDTPGGLDQFANELREAMATTEGGTSRFGALAEVLNGKLSKRWKMFTPP